MEDWRRPLSRIESLIWRMDRCASLNFTTVAHVEGPLTAGALQTGLAALQERHPFFRAHIEMRGRDPWFVSGAGGLPLTIEDCPEDAWLPHASREVQNRFDYFRGPFARLVWLRHGENRSRLLLTLHHSVSDGKSGAFAMDDLLSATGAALEGRALTLKPLGVSPEPESIFPPALFSGAEGWRVLFSTFKRIIGYHWGRGFPKAYRFDGGIPAEQKATRHFWKTFTREESAALLAHAHNENTTVNGILAGAIMLAAARENPQPHLMCFGAPVDLREKGTASLGRAMGMYVSMCMAYAWMDGRGLFPLAREVRDQIQEGVRNGEHFVFLPKQMIPHYHLHRWLGEAAWGRRLLSRLALAAMPSAVGLTNIGVTPAKDRYGPLELISQGFVVSPGILGHAVFSAASAAGRISLGLGYDPPFLTEEHARRVFDLTLQELAPALNMPE
ncbi:MAG: hypothetical protein GMKNLPBB_03054 [Myxococcota bacterium]|nr:hypothetical protein [Myxococcota bacterium]